MAQPRNWYSNIKLIFLILFVLIFVGFAIRDMRAGDVSSPLIFAGMLLLIALIFRPWRTGSDEGTPLPRDKKPPSSYLLAPLLMQDGPTPLMETPLATIVLAVLLGCAAVVGAYFAIRYFINRTNERDVHS